MAELERSIITYDSQVLLVQAIRKLVILLFYYIQIFKKIIGSDNIYSLMQLSNKAET